MRQLAEVFVFISVLVLPYSYSVAESPSKQTTYALTRQNLTQEALGQKSGPTAKIGHDLAGLSSEHQSFLRQRTVNQIFERSNPLLRMVDGRVAIDAVASGDVNALKSGLEALGMQNTAVVGRIVSGQLPISAIEDAAALESLQFLRPVYSMNGAGSVTSQGDAAMRSDYARTVSGVDGTGVTVGTISNSFDCLGEAKGDVASGDLPRNIQVLEEISDCGFSPDTGGIDEGRAMMQIIHDVAPGAGLKFHSGADGQAHFASAVKNLAKAGTDVIVDDLYVSVFEPMFQDGIGAQAINTVVRKGGVAYFSFAGNERRDSYESPFRPSGTDIIIGGISAGEAHDFDPAPGIDIFQNITVLEGDFFVLALQWDSPFFSVSGPPGATNDIDVYILDDPPTKVLAQSNDVNIGGDAAEAFRFENPAGSGVTKFNILITRYTGPKPGFMKYVLVPQFLGTINEYNTRSGTVFGHRNAAGAETVGGAFFGNTPKFGVDPARLWPFSSAGPTPILFDKAGRRLSKPKIRRKPEVVAPTGTNTTFFGEDIADDPDTFPNFFGTSASAPHAAGVAALMLDKNSSLSPATIYTILENTADNMLVPGFDFGSGFGFIRANRAVKAVPLTSISDEGLTATKFGTNGNAITPKLTATGSFTDPRDPQMNPTSMLTTTGSFTDPRDRQVYPTSTLGGRTWLARNLNFAISGSSFCYNNNPRNCTQDGRLYTFSAARIACPTGWHLPSDAEWQSLEAALGMPANQLNLEGVNTVRGTTEGTQFKGNMHMAGFRRGTAYSEIGVRNYYWTSTMRGTDVWRRRVWANLPTIFRFTNSPNGFAISVRCVSP